MKSIRVKSLPILFVCFITLFTNNIFASPQLQTDRGYPVVLDSDTLFMINTGIGIFTAQNRADEITKNLGYLVEHKLMQEDSLLIVGADDYLIIKSSEQVLMAVTKADANSADSSSVYALAEQYKKSISNKLSEMKEVYSSRSLILNGIYSLAYLAGLIVFFVAASFLFPFLYKQLEKIGSREIKDIEFKGKDVVKSKTIIAAIIVFLRGLRFALSLYAVYIFIVNTILLWPYTRRWDLQPYIKSIVFFIFYTVFFIALSKGINALTRLMSIKYLAWKETKIKSIKIKNIEILSAERAIETLTFITKLFRFAVLVIIFYLYITIAFSLFEFSETWAQTLINYTLTPLKSVVNSILKFLPNLFFIIVLSFVFNYIIKFVKFIFLEIDKGTLDFPGFHRDWAIPTFKITRFLILVLAAIIIFPYLPGSDSPFFQGISVFLGILFSLGSSSAIANMVSGIVLTYMRPFRLGDRVKIAETMGDVVEKTLLVTRIRTPKNVDITIPNAMVLGSHIINYSSSSRDKGLILHTTVTIGYDVPWKKVHELLLSAALETEHILKEPKPFVLQTSLDDFYVSYELNLFTNDPGKMAGIYSELHSKIQDKFNEGGVEIMSPHYGAMRDGNQTTIPQDYLPKTYEPPSFKILGVNLFSAGNKKSE